MEVAFTLGKFEPFELRKMYRMKHNSRATVPKDVTCRQCGTTTTPVWRKGPYGPHT